MYTSDWIIYTVHATIGNILECPRKYIPLDVTGKLGMHQWNRWWYKVKGLRCPTLLQVPSSHNICIEIARLYHFNMLTTLAHILHMDMLPSAFPTSKFILSLKDIETLNTSWGKFIFSSCSTPFQRLIYCLVFFSLFYVPAWWPSRHLRPKRYRFLPMYVAVGKVVKVHRFR